MLKKRSYKMANFGNRSTILALPDLVLHHICSYISCPFDLIRLGNTCRRLRHISSSNKLWWNLTLNWLTGLWPNIEHLPLEVNARDWLLAFLHNVMAPRSSTKTICDFKNGEIWKRADTEVFRCVLGMLQTSYINKFKECHPAVLYERWLYDIGIYKREQPSIKFHDSNDVFSDSVVSELATLGQAKERDLRARKQPNLNPMYYIKIADTSLKNWTNDLFSKSYHGSLCPLLLDPFRNAFTDEVSGVSGLLICLTIVLEKHVRSRCKSKIIPIQDLANLMKGATNGFYEFIQENLPVMKEMWGQYCLTHAMEHMCFQDTFDTSGWQNCLNKLCIPLQSKTLILDVRNLIKDENGIDCIVDKVRFRWRKQITHVIQKILSIEKDESITRVNITDSDLIGGDNMRQEMAAAAFVSKNGVLVTWHLTGRLRY